MYYEIIVSQNGRHLFAAAPRSIITEAAAVAFLALIYSKFPEDEGYKVSCTHWVKRGYGCEQLEALAKANAGGTVV